jgi:hypothetical protein
MAVEYVVAQLNILSGATPTYLVQETLNSALSLLSYCSWSRSQQYTAQNLRETLSDFNSGNGGYGN